MLAKNMTLPKRMLWILAVPLFVLVVLSIKRYRGFVEDGVHRHNLLSKWTEPETGLGSENLLINEVYNGTLGFEKIIVVSLPSRTDRRDGIVLQAALSQMSIDFVDGISGSSVMEKAIPTSEGSSHIMNAELGSWRGHMNAIQEVVQKNMTSVLIMEDDGDWDIRLKQQLHDFALSSQALTQPLARGRNLHVYADPTYPQPRNTTNKIIEFNFNRLPATIPPNVSPYGDEWDVLWIGHCAQTFPVTDNKGLPLGRVIRFNDETVPQKKYLDSPFIKPFVLKDDYPDHTRVVHHSQWGACTLAYAVSQRGARKILQEIGLKNVNAPFDLLLRSFCDGRQDRGGNKCLTTQPSLVVHHLQAGSPAADSDIQTKDGKGQYRAAGESKEIRWSVRLNAEALLRGDALYVDRYPDDA